MYVHWTLRQHTQTLSLIQHMHTSLLQVLLESHCSSYVEPPKISWSHLWRSMKFSHRRGAIGWQFDVTMWRRGHRNWQCHTIEPCTSHHHTGQREDSGCSLQELPHLQLATGEERLTFNCATTMNAMRGLSSYWSLQSGSSDDDIHKTRIGEVGLQGTSSVVTKQNVSIRYKMWVWN